MERKINYWLHRISHKWEVSYALFDKGYLSLGWSSFSDKGILDAARKGETEFEKTYKTLNNDKNKSRWNMWYFAQFKKGDYVVVPLYNGEFSICEVEDVAKPINAIQSEIGNFKDRTGKKITWENGLLIKEDEKDDEKKTIDLGFVVKVQPKQINGTTRPKRNLYADSALTSRMKMRQTNGDVNDLASSIDAVISATNPINFYENAISQGSTQLLKRIQEDLDDIKFEKLIKAYMDKIGADYTYIPPKKESGKKNYADADIIAVFETLRITIHIQAKHHKYVTDSWAVEQIKEYKKQIQNEKSELYHEKEDDFTIIPWVISTCDTFSDEAIKASQNDNDTVRLINGLDFSRMLMDAGLANIDKYIQVAEK